MFLLVFVVLTLLKYFSIWSLAFHLVYSIIFSLLVLFWLFLFSNLIWINVIISF